jgi:SAM-dependent methyltransferase
MIDARQYAPATARNRDPILEVLRDVLPASGLVLEIASGTGEHAVHFARAFPGITWQPSDPDANARASIAAWRDHVALPNLNPPLALDVIAHDWPVTAADAVVCINMVHISPWAATLGLLSGAARILPPGGPLYLYGPYKRNGAHTAPSNADFDTSLRSRNPDWGVRDVANVADAATGFTCARIVEMPANNLSVVLRKH